MKSLKLSLRLIALGWLCSSAFVGCPCTDSLLNASPALQWAAFSRFGANKVCEEMTKRGALITMDVPIPGFPPATGRFFPQTCQSAINDDRRTLSIWLTGNGYAWTPATQKISFECQASVEYSARLNKDGGTIYVWFEPASSPPMPSVRITFVEQQPAGTFLRLPSADSFASSLASGFVSSQLSRGFTVIHESGGDDFALGQIPLGKRPTHPFDTSGSERFTLANEITIVHGMQQDFLGPFEVDNDDRALFLKLEVQGPPVDVFVVSKDVGTSWRMAYARSSPPPSSPPGAPILKIAQTPPNGLFQGWVPLKKGSYYIVLDNSASAGFVAPPPQLPTPFDPSFAQASSVRALVELGDIP